MKQKRNERDVTAARRPFTGAWIETVNALTESMLKMVAPSRGRGLKRGQKVVSQVAPRVAPSRGRGLKQHVKYPQYAND